MHRLSPDQLQDRNLTIVWDGEGPPPSGACTVILWRGDKPDSGAISLPLALEEESGRFRDRYLAWLREAGETRIGGTSLVERLEVEPGFSYWWMTSVAQKFNAAEGSPVTDTIKLIALDEMILRQSPRALLLVSGNAALRETLADYCRRMRIDFRCLPSSSNAIRQPLIRRILSLLPFPLQAFVYLLRYAVQALVRGRTAFSSPSARDVDAGISFFDMLVHLDKASLDGKRFVSNYWTVLPAKLEELGMRANWFHHFYRHSAIPSVGHARALTAKLSASSGGKQTHRLIEAVMVRGSLLGALARYLRIARLGGRIDDCIPAFGLRGSCLNFWPMFKREWRESFRGVPAITNSIWLSLYQRLLNGLPRQQLGIYIQENQAWEMALIHYWKKFGHGELVGVAHTSVRFWDLRYFHDAQVWRAHGISRMPAPDRTAVNGPAALRICLEGHYPENRLVAVEALRFMQLSSLEKRPAAPRVDGPLRILALGEFQSSNVRNMLDWLDEAVAEFPPRTEITFKPHPACPVMPKAGSPIKPSDSHATLSDLVDNCDVVVAGNTTSAVLDAYYRRIPIIQLADGNQLNLSPLKGLNYAAYVCSAAELKNKLIGLHGAGESAAETYFYLEPDLPRWRELLVRHHPADAGRQTAVHL